MRQALKRALWLVILTLLIFTASRALVRLLPGDPIETLLAETGSAIPREALSAELGLDRPFFRAAARDIANAFNGDFGRSLITRQEIAPLIAVRFTKTAILAFLTLTFGLSSGLAIGLLAAASPRGFPGNIPSNIPGNIPGNIMDRFCTFHGALAASLPTPWIGPIFMIVFAVWIPLFPISNNPILAAITLSVGFSGFWGRLIRERVRETLLTGAATGARARGAPEWLVLFKYGLAPASGALAAFLGTQIGGLLAGSFVAEIVFDWQGMGALLVDSVLSRDYPVVEAAVFVTASVSLMGSALGDAAQKLLDPRL